MGDTIAVPEDGKKSSGETNRSRMARFRALARQAPLQPGVYLMRDESGEIIYVGKAKTLQNRLGSYFSGRKDLKTRHLVARISQIEWIIAGTEYEALLLENTLIKKHTPKYNINLKDGKTYPSIRITNEAFPRVFRTRRIIDDGSRYFGPFPSADLIDTYLDLIRRLFPLRRCRSLRKRSEPCMYWHIGRCSAPCAGKVTEEEYARSVEEVAKLLSGETEALLAELRARMAEAAEARRYEEAARLRDTLRAIEEFEGSAGVVDQDPEDRDYLAFAADGELATWVAFQMRGGRLTGRDLFRTRLFTSEAEGLASFITTYYDQSRPPPPRVVVPSLEGLELIPDWFSRELGATVELCVPSGEGERRHAAALGLAAQNAREDLVKRRRELGDPQALAELREALGLARVPERIEGFDIAHLEGKHMVASLITFRNGIPERKGYRSFGIKSLQGSVDDFAAMREAISRRYTRLMNEDAELPDLVLVDGGAGQVSAAREILEALGAEIEVAGLAKRNEEVWLPGRSEPVVLPKDSPALRVLVAVRDETHRFATGHNQRLRAADLKFGRLEAVAGVGAARARKLMKAYGSLDLLLRAPAADLAKAGGMGLEVAERLLEALGGETLGVGGRGSAAAAREAAEPKPSYGAS
jgi:excinuclease ABC subunit C